jgi:uncharacterized protein YkuJ
MQFMRTAKRILPLVALAGITQAQRVFEQDGKVIFEDAAKRQTNI